MINEIVELLAIKSRPLGTKLEVRLNAQYDLSITPIDLPFVPAPQNSAVVVRGGERLAHRGYRVATAIASMRTRGCWVDGTSRERLFFKSGIRKLRPLHPVHSEQCRCGRCNREQTGDAQPVPARFSRYHATSANAGAVQGEY